MTRLTGERVTTQAGGFNPTWQRHVAAYAACDELLPEGTVLDVGCGIGHSYELLAPRETVGVDVDPEVLRGQGRPTRVADMRSLPFADASFEALVSVHSLEHVPDPGRALAEARRVLAPGGTAVFVTPNRLTFGPPDEIVDPYHHVEFSAGELERACSREFEHVHVRGLFGSPRYAALVAAERRTLDRLLACDPLEVRRAVPRRARQWLYDRLLERARRADSPAAREIGPDDFELRDGALDSALDLVAICGDARTRAGVADRTLPRAQ